MSSLLDSFINLTVKATDGDFGSNGDIRYTIKVGGRDDFRINDLTGAIMTSGNDLIYIEGQQPAYNMTVSVSFLCFSWLYTVKPHLS